MQRSTRTTADRTEPNPVNHTENMPTLRPLSSALAMAATITLTNDAPQKQAEADFYMRRPQSFIIPPRNQRKARNRARRTGIHPANPKRR